MLSTLKTVFTFALMLAAFPVEAKFHIVFEKMAPDDRVGEALEIERVFSADPEARGLIVLEGPAEAVTYTAHYVRDWLTVYDLQERFQVLHGLTWDEQTISDIKAERYQLSLKNELLHATALGELGRREGLNLELQDPVVAINAVNRILREAGPEGAAISGYSDLSTLTAALLHAKSFAELRALVRVAEANGSPLLLDRSLTTKIATLKWMAGAREVSGLSRFSRAWALNFSHYGAVQGTSIINQLTSLPGSVIFSTSIQGGNMGRADSFPEQFKRAAEGLGVSSDPRIRRLEQYFTETVPETWINAVNDNILATKGIRGTIPPGYASFLGAALGGMDVQLQPLRVSGFGNQFDVVTTVFNVEKNQTEMTDAPQLAIRCKVVTLPGAETVERLVHTHRPPESAAAALLDQLREKLKLEPSNALLQEMLQPTAANDSELMSVLLRHVSLLDLASSRADVLKEFVPLLIFSDIQLDDTFGLKQLLLHLVATASKRPVYIITQSFDTRLQKHLAESALHPFRAAGLDIHVIAGSGGELLSAEAQRQLAEFAITGASILSHGLVPPEILHSLHAEGENSEASDFLRDLLIRRRMPVDVLALSDVRELSLFKERYDFQALSSIRRFLPIGFWQYNADGKVRPAYNGRLYPATVPFLTEWMEVAKTSNWGTRFYHVPSSEFRKVFAPGMIQAGRLSHPDFKSILELLAKTRSFGFLGQMLLTGYETDTASFDDSRLRTGQVTQITRSVNRYGEFYTADPIGVCAAISLFSGNHELFPRSEAPGLRQKLVELWNPREAIKLPTWTSRAALTAGSGETFSVQHLESSAAGQATFEELFLEPTESNYQRIAQVISGSAISALQLARAMDKSVGQYRKQIASAATCSRKLVQKAKKNSEQNQTVRALVANQ